MVCEKKPDLPSEKEKSSNQVVEFPSPKQFEKRDLPVEIIDTSRKLEHEDLFKSIIAK